MENNINRMINAPLFDQIAPSELTHLLQCIGAFTKTYDAGSYIVLDGESVECVGVVITGCVHIIKEDDWGQKTIISIIEPMQLFGETSVFGASNQSFVSIFSVEKSEVLFLPLCGKLHTCPKSCGFHQKLVDNMVSIIVQKNLQLTERLEVATKRSIRSKILTYLVQESQKRGSKYFTIPLGRLEMAEFLCVDRSALTRELSKMKDERILDYSYNTFRLL